METLNNAHRTIENNVSLMKFILLTFILFPVLTFSQTSKYYYNQKPLDEGITSVEHKEMIGKIYFHPNVQINPVNVISEKNGVYTFNHLRGIYYSIYLKHSPRYYYEKWNTEDPSTWKYDTTEVGSTYGNGQDIPTEGYFIFELSVNGRKINVWRRPILKYGFFHYTHFKDNIWEYSSYVDEEPQHDNFKYMSCAKCQNPLYDLFVKNPVLGMYKVELKVFMGKPDPKSASDINPKPLAKGTFFIELNEEVIKELKRDGIKKDHSFTFSTYPIKR